MLKWRWEFMRRNSEYQSDYKKFQALKENDTQIKKELYTKWDFGNTLENMLDPDKTFKELFENPDDLTEADFATMSDKVKKWIPVFHRLSVYKALDPNAVTVGPRQTEEETVEETVEMKLNGEEVLMRVKRTKTDPPNCLTLHIDFSKVNSIPGLKKMINSLIDRRVEMISHLNHLRSQNDPIACAIPPENLAAIHKTNKTDFEVILQIGDLKREGLTNQQVAKKMFPRDFNLNNESANPESKIRLISGYYERYNRLVNGGYKTLTFP